MAKKRAPSAVGPFARPVVPRTADEERALALAAPRLWGWSVAHLGGFADTRDSKQVRAIREKVGVVLRATCGRTVDAARVVAAVDERVARASPYDTAHAVALLGWAAWAGVIEWDDAWTRVVAAHTAIRWRYPSWAAYGAAYVETERAISDDRSDPSGVIATLLAPGGHWHARAW